MRVSLTLCLVVSAHRAATTASLQAEVPSSGESWLAPLHALKDKIPRTMSAALSGITASLQHAHATATGAWEGAEHAAVEASQGPAKFGFLLEDEEKSTVKEALVALKGLANVEHDVEASIANIEHHMHASPSSFLEDTPSFGDQMNEIKDHMEKIVGTGEDKLAGVSDAMAKLKATDEKVEGIMKKANEAMEARAKKDGWTPVETKVDPLDSPSHSLLETGLPGPNDDEENPEDGVDEAMETDVVHPDENEGSDDEEKEDETTQTTQTDDPEPATETATEDPDDPEVVEEPEELSKEMRTHPSSLLQESPDSRAARAQWKHMPEPSRDDKKYQAQFRAMDNQLKREIDSMDPAHAKASSLVETGGKYVPTDHDPLGKPFRVLASKAADVQKQLEADIKNLNPDTPDLTGPDVAQSAKELFDQIGAPEGTPSSLLQTKAAGGAAQAASGDVQSNYEKELMAIGDKTSWAQIGASLEKTKKESKEDLYEFHKAFPDSPTSFVEVGSHGVPDGELDTGDWTSKMKTLGATTTWKELDADMAKSRDKAMASVQEFKRAFPDSPYPSSFAEVQGKATAEATAGVSAASAAQAQIRAQVASQSALAAHLANHMQEGMDAAAPQREKVSLLESKTHSAMAAVDAKLDAFLLHTNDEISQLEVPHTSIAAALRRAEAQEIGHYPSSLMETSGASVEEITAKSQLDALQAQQARDFEAQANQVDSAFGASEDVAKPQAVLSLVQTDSTGRQGAEQALQGSLSQLQLEVAALKGENEGQAQAASSFAQTGEKVGNRIQSMYKTTPSFSSWGELDQLKEAVDKVPHHSKASSFAQTGEKVPSYDELDARLKRLEQGVSSHLAELQGDAHAAPSSFAQADAESTAGAQVWMEQRARSMRRAASRQRALELEHDLEETEHERLAMRHRRDPTPMSSPELTAAALKHAEMKKKNEENLKKSAAFLRLQESMLGLKGLPTKQQQAAWRANELSLLTKMFGPKAAKMVPTLAEADKLDQDVADALKPVDGEVDGDSDSSPNQDDSSLLQVGDPLADATVATIDRISAANEKARETPDTAMDNAMEGLRRFSKEVADIPKTYSHELKTKVLSELQEPAA